MHHTIAHSVGCFLCDRPVRHLMLAELDRQLEDAGNAISQHLTTADGTYCACQP